ncbi:hypothetical protein V6N13_019964 [Hibiscus sabdariffa]
MEACRRRSVLESFWVLVVAAGLSKRNYPKEKLKMLTITNNFFEDLVGEGDDTKTIEAKRVWSVYNKFSYGGSHRHC